MEFKEKVRIARKRLFLSQAEFAKEIGVAYATVNRWESGICMPNYSGQKAFHNFCVKNNIEFTDKGD
ncbi:XRE family transcriptional regulator [bacterium]|nr:XRE family transcriptional regulator [bacterium]